MKKISLIALILSVSAICLQLFILSTTKTENTDEDYKQSLKVNYKVLAPVLPEKVSFAGESMPMDVFYVRENLDRALLMHMYWQSNTVLLIKRANRCFPMIEDILKKNGIPEDFKYLCMAESGLINATSSAKAQGYWQFMKGTGEKYNLEINDEVDQRNCLRKSTEAACAFLKDLYKKFGSWTLVAAAYNRGETGLQKQIDLQKEDNYYHLFLNSETSFYLFRIVAYKLIMESPQDYGFVIRKKDLYPEVPTYIVQVDSSISNLHDFALQNNSSYKMLKMLNPWLVDTKLTNKGKKVYEIELPVKNGIYQKNIQKEKSTEALK